MQDKTTRTARISFQPLLPKSGWQDLYAVYLCWSTVGFASVVVANSLDQFSGIAYSTHYTDAVNAAIGFNFWLLIGSIGLILLCLALPFIYFFEAHPVNSGISQKIRYLVSMFFLVAYDEGALMIGILLATMCGFSDRADLIVSKTLLFSEQSLSFLCLVLIVNTLLWWIGESIYNRQDKSASGLLTLALSCPVKFLLPGYLIFCAVFAIVLIQ